MVMDAGDREVVAIRREWADREVEKAKEMVARYKERAREYRDVASGYAHARDFAMAHHFNKMADEATNDMHYWLGHMNAYMGVATQLGFAEMVEEELEEEGSCP